MPLVKLEKINQNSSWALWKIDETLEQLVQYVDLHPADLTELHDIHHPGKKLEWLSGRAALRALLNAENQQAFRLHKDEKGKPHLNDHIFHISLANSYPYGVAIIHRNHPVGIDIEKPSLKLVRVKHKFLNAVEENEVQEDLHKLCIYWATKESLYKLYGRKQLSLKQNIAIRLIRWPLAPIIEADIFLEGRSTSFQLCTLFWDEFYIVYSMMH
ncbi:MAG: 4'-phosphopantetheinyl transferase superfamily protein [Cyclobacteriaceae bacterium]